MKKETDMTEVKSVAKMLLMTDVHETEFSPIVVQHPFTSSGIVVLLEKDSKNFKSLDITQDAENLKAWRRAVSSAIDHTENPYELYMMVNKPYALAFLKYASPYLSKKDFSEILSSAWIMCEAPHNDPEVSLGKLVAMFQSADPKVLMDEDEYKEFQGLGDTLTVYRGVPEAIRLLTLSADKGFTPAEYLLGKIYYRGEAIPQDIPKALAYLERAAENKNPYAAYLAGKIFLTEDAVRDVQKAIRLLKIAAAQENDYAEYQLGKLYLYGKDVPQDYEEAIRWLTASAEHGNQYAGQLLHSIRNNQNWSAAMGAFRLLHHISRIIQNRLEDERRGKDGAHIDRKLRRRIQDKNEALGIKQG